MRILEKWLKMFASTRTALTVEQKAAELLRLKDQYKECDHNHTTLLKCRISGNTGTFKESANKLVLIKEHLINEANQPIPRLYLSTKPNLLLYTMHAWLYDQEGYATMDELFEFIENWLYLCETAYTLRSSIKSFNIHSAEPEMRKYKSVSSVVANSEKTISDIMEYIQCYQK